MAILSDESARIFYLQLSHEVYVLFFINSVPGAGDDSLMELTNQKSRISLIRLELFMYK